MAHGTYILLGWIPSPLSSGVSISLTANYLYFMAVVIYLILNMHL